MSLHTYIHTYIHAYHSRFIPKGVAEVSQIFLRDTHVLPKLVSHEEHCRRDRWFAVLLQSISGVSAINPLVAFYDIHGGKREVLFFYFVPDTTRDCFNNRKYIIKIKNSLFSLGMFRYTCERPNIGNKNCAQRNEYREGESAVKKLLTLFTCC
jgi:hypothetical protein